MVLYPVRTIPDHLINLEIIAHRTARLPGGGLWRDGPPLDPFPPGLSDPFDFLSFFAGIDYCSASMALSMSNLLALWMLMLLPWATEAVTVTYDFNISWTTANPDGQFVRSVIGINDQWPIPQIRAQVGDQIIINAHNGLGNASTSLHFHGLFQNGTTEMDGPAGVNQCPIPPGSTMVYNFTVSLGIEITMV